MSARILVVTLNPALDVTHELARVDWAGVNRPDVVRTRPGGKGINVARTLHALGANPLVLGLAGGRTGVAVSAKAAAAGLRADFTEITGETRRTFAVVDRGRGQTALFNEPGPHVSAVEYGTFLARYQVELPASAVVLTGSLPRGLPADCYAELAGYAAAEGVPVLLDAEGQPLLEGLAAGPAIVKPNLAELSGVVGRPLTADIELGWSAIVAAADELRPSGYQARHQTKHQAGTEADPAPSTGAVVGVGGGIEAGARAVVVSLGEHGLIAVTGDGTWRAWPRAMVSGNPTGAGDAVVAGLALGLAEDRPWPARLRQAAALGAATAAAPVAGEFSPGGYEHALPGIEVDRLEAG